MSNIIDKILAEVCLDERVTDGIFRMDEEEHMNALRDYLTKRGLTKEDSIHVTNKMTEGKYPDRQAWRVEDGILVTWPSPKPKANAMAKNPGKYTDKDPSPGASTQPEKEPKTAPAGSKPEPGEKPADGDSDSDSDDVPLPKSSADDDDDEPEEKQPTIFQGEKELQVEPPRGSENPNVPAPPASTTPATPRTPSRIAAEKEVIKQILSTDVTNASAVGPSDLTKIGENAQLNSLENNIRTMQTEILSVIGRLPLSKLKQLHEIIIVQFGER